MADETTTTEAPAAETAAPDAPVAEKAAAAPAAVAAVKKVVARRVKAERKPRGRKAGEAVAKPAPAAATRKPRVVSATITRRAAPAAAPKTEQKDPAMNFDFNNWTSTLPSFGNLPGADRFQTLFADAGSRGQEALEKGRRTAEELAELTRANVEAVVEAGKIAATGAKTVGEDALSRAKAGFEQNAAELKTLAGATSPSEFFQLQGEIAKSNFDRIVANLSQLTEASVKLAGEAMQPLSSRAAVSAEKLGELSA